MNAKELREKSVKELEKELATQKVQAQNLYVDVTVKQEKSLAKYHDARKTIARILTTLNEKKRAARDTNQPTQQQKP